MLRVKESQHGKQRKLRHDEPVPALGISPRLLQIPKESDGEGQCCFVTIAAQSHLQDITLEDYFDRFINHLEIGGTIHVFNNAKSTKVDQLWRADLIGEATSP
jgi:hypothetical protein